MAETPAGTPAPESNATEQARIDAIVATRVNEKNTRIQQLETELGTLRPKAQGYDTVNNQLLDATTRAQRAEQQAGYFKAALPHGFDPAVVEHLAGKYNEAQNALPVAQRSAFPDWLGAVLADPGKLDPISGAAVREHLARRTAGTTTTTPTTTATTPATTPVVVAPTATGTTPATPATTPAPRSNNGVVVAPTPVAMSEEERTELVKDGERWRQYLIDHPEEAKRMGVSVPRAKK